MKPQPTADFYASRERSIKIKELGRLQRGEYFIDKECKLDTEQQLDHYAGATSVDAYKKQLEVAEDKHGPGRVYVICRIIAHGVKHYERGWDVLVECTEVDEIDYILQQNVSKWNTINEAIKVVADELCLEVYNDVRNDALAAGGLEITNFDLGLDA